MTYADFKESQFPQDYRQAQVQSVVGAVRAARSCTVIGGAGMGKSNLLRFLVANPALRVPERLDPDRCLLVLVDVNRVRDEVDLFRMLCVELAREGGLSQTVPLALEAAEARHLLTEIVAELSPRHLVCMLDPLDNAAVGVGPCFYRFLRALRDTSKNISYILGMRRPPAPGELDELAELMDAPCWVGPLSPADAAASLGRDEARLGCAFSDCQREALITYSGGHPGLLKNSSDLLARGGLDLAAPHNQIVAQLLAYGPIQQCCADIWQDLAQEERGVLWQTAATAARGKAAKGRKFFPLRGTAANKRARSYLQVAGLITAQEKPFSPILERYTAGQAPDLVSVDTDLCEIRRGYEIINLPLTSLPGQLLTYLYANAGRRVPLTELSRVLYRDAGPNPQAITDLAAAVEEIQTDIDAIDKLLGDPRQARRRLETCREGLGHLISAIKALTAPSPDDASRVHALVFRVRQRMGADVIDSNPDGYLFRQPDH